MNDHNEDIEVVEEEYISPSEKRRKRMVFITGTGIFAAISTLLYIISVPPFVFPLIPAVPFLHMNFSELPALIAGFAYGPISGLIVLVIRFLIKLPMTNTAFVGELADLLYSSSFVIVASLIYLKKRTFKGVFLGLGIAFISQIIVSTTANYVFMYDFYSNLYTGGKLHETLPKTTFIAWSIPFNLLKNLIISTLTILVYKKVVAAINKIVK